MKKELYKELMENLDSALYDGFNDVLSMTPKELLDDMIDCTAINIEDTPEKEVHDAIHKWQEKTRSEFPND